MFIRRYFQIIVIFLVITGIFLWAWTTNGSEGIVASDIVITEIAANVANENDDEYFIIRNITCQDINLEGISVRDAARYISRWETHCNKPVFSLTLVITH